MGSNYYCYFCLLCRSSKWSLYWVLFSKPCFPFRAGVAYTSECFPCKPGTFSNKPGSFNCQMCPRNTYSEKGAKECIRCKEDSQFSGKANWHVLFLSFHINCWPGAFHTVEWVWQQWWITHQWDEVNTCWIDPHVLLCMTFSLYDFPYSIDDWRLHQSSQLFNFTQFVTIKAVALYLESFSLFQISSDHWQDRRTLISSGNSHPEADVS